MEKEFNSYPALEKRYGETAFEMSNRDISLIDNIIENYNKMVKEFRKHKRREFAQ